MDNQEMNYNTVAKRIKDQLSNQLNNEADVIDDMIVTCCNYIDQKNMEGFQLAFKELVMMWPLLVEFNINNGAILSEIFIDGQHELWEYLTIEGDHNNDSGD